MYTYYTYMCTNMYVYYIKKYKFWQVCELTYARIHVYVYACMYIYIYIYIYIYTHFGRCVSSRMRESKGNRRSFLTSKTGSKSMPYSICTYEYTYMHTYLREAGAHFSLPKQVRNPCHIPYVHMYICIYICIHTYLRVCTYATKHSLFAFVSSTRSCKHFIYTHF